MNHEQKLNLEKIINENLTSGKLHCAVAHKLSKELNISLSIIGKTADEMKIKITGCQLGCFN